MSTPSHTLHETLAQARKAAKLSQAGLGQQMGLPQSHISNIERGLVDPQTGNLVEMARLLGYEVMLVPLQLVPAVTAIIRGNGVEERSLPSSLLDDE